MVHAAIRRIAKGEAEAAGAEREPDVELVNAFPAVVNEGAAVERVREAFTSAMPDLIVLDPGEVTGSEDVARIVAGLPSNHSPFYAPVIDPTLGIGVKTLHAAARAWLA